MSDEEPYLLPRHACAVCGHVLDYVHGAGWSHGIGDASLWDHPAVPVLATDLPALEERCDFCYADSTSWVIPARSFVSMGASSGGNWAACDECCRLVETNQWNALLRRVKTSWTERHGEMEQAVESGLRALYRQLRKNITGPARRV